MRIAKKYQYPFRVAKIRQKWRFCQEKTECLPAFFGNIWQLRRLVNNTMFDILHPNEYFTSRSVAVNSLGEKIKRGRFLHKKGEIYVPFDITKHTTLDGILSTNEHCGISFCEIYTSGRFVAYKLAEANDIRWYNNTYSLNNHDASISGESYFDFLKKSCFDVRFCYSSVLEFLLDYYTNNDKKLKVIDENGKKQNLFNLIA